MNAEWDFISMLRDEAAGRRSIAAAVAMPSANAPRSIWTIAGRHPIDGASWHRRRAFSLIWLAFGLEHPAAHARAALIALLFSQRARHWTQTFMGGAAGFSPHSFSAFSCSAPCSAS
jgi:hypothetical protein